MQYATEQPKMCQFLIENGAEVDELARDPDCLNFDWYVAFK
jgi:hypothetical protein